MIRNAGLQACLWMCAPKPSIRTLVLRPDSAANPKRGPGGPRDVGELALAWEGAPAGHSAAHVRHGVVGLLARALGAKQQVEPLAPDPVGATVRYQERQEACVTHEL